MNSRDMVPFTIQDRVDQACNAFVLKQDEGTYLVYPSEHLGPGYGLEEKQLEPYLAWLKGEWQSELRPPRRAVVLFLLIGFFSAQLTVLGLLPKFPFFLTSLMAAVAFIWWYVRSYQKCFRFRFEKAVRVETPRPWRRIVHGLLVSRTHTMLRCVLGLIIFLTLFAYLPLLTKTRLPPEFSLDSRLFYLVMTGGLLLYSLSSAYFFIEHVRFRLRHNRAPVPADLGTLL